MRVVVKNQEIPSISVERPTSHFLDTVKDAFANLFSSREASQDRALDLLQSSKGFDPVRNPQSLIFPRSVMKERSVDKRLPVRRAA